jgi:hypothetical protein
MPPAIILNSASKANTSGGTFADTLTANSGDTLAIQNYISGGARIFSMWGIDSDSVAELALTDTRTDSIHDPQYGIRFNIPSLIPGGAASVGSHYLVSEGMSIPVYSGDALTMTVTTTAADDVLVSWLTQYDDLPGVSGQFARWESVQALRETTIGCRVAPVASGTPGLYGTARAINADDARWTGGKYYAILGWTVQTVCTTIAFAGQAWGNNKTGGPSGALTTDTTMYFVDLYKQSNIPCIPVFNGYDAANVFLYAADGEASTSPKVDVLAYQLSGNPTGA